MRHTQIRCRRAATAGSVPLFGGPGSIVFCFIAIALGAVSVYAQAQALDSPKDLLAANPAAFAGLLETARPAPVTAEEKATILRDLPHDGAIPFVDLPESGRRKLAALDHVLRPTQRLAVYEIRVIAIPQAAIALHARSVVLISEAALTLLGLSELQALVAHEIGHEYLWLDYQRASRIGNDARLRQLELLCDGIAIVTLLRLGMDPSRLMSGVDKVFRFNRQRFGVAENEKAFPTVADRRQFAQAVITWARAPVRPGGRDDASNATPWLSAQRCIASCGKTVVKW